jgi:hypothetical protein
MTLAGHSVSLGGTQTFALGDLSNINNSTIVGNNSGGAGPPLALSTSAISTMLGLGTMANQSASAVAITGGSITGLGLPSGSTDAATKSYVDSVATGLVVHTQVSVATAAILPNTPTYSNGSSGVGATLTSATNTALVVDGQTISVTTTRVLVKNEVTGANNGIYTLTQAGSGSVPWILTRATDFNTATTGNIAAGAYVFVSIGTANAATGWQMNTSGAITVGTTALNWVQFLGNTAYTADGSTISLTGSQFAALPNGILSSVTSTPNSLLARGASTWAGVAPVNNAVLSTNGAGVPSESTTLPSGLTIPGYLTANQTITLSGAVSGFGTTAITTALASTGDGTLLSNISGGSAAPSANSLSSIIDHDIGSTTNAFLFRGPSTWGLMPSANNAVLSTNSSGVPGESTILPSGLTIPGYLTGLVNGPGISVTGGAPTPTVSTVTTNNTFTSSYTVTASDMNGAVNLAGTSATPTLTLPVHSGTIFAPGMSIGIAVTGTIPWTITNLTGLTMTGLNSTTLPPGSSGSFVANTNGAEINFYPGVQTPTVTVLGGVRSVDCSSGNQFLQKINTDGTENCAGAGTGSGNVVGSGASTVGNLGAINDTATSTLVDSGIPKQTVKATMATSSYGIAGGI